MMKKGYNSDSRKQWEMGMCYYLNIEYNEAHKIAQAKIEYKKKTIAKLEQYQKKSYCRKRADQIAFLKEQETFEEFTCLRDAQIAYAKYYKHQYTDYDKYLADGQRKVKIGLLPYGTAKNYANQMMLQELEIKKMAS